MRSRHLLSARDRAALLRLLALYVAVILAWQGLAAAFALGSGPLHQHRAVPSSPWAPVEGRSHSHAGGERHHHVADDATVQPLLGGEENVDLLAFALTSALALLALGAMRHSARQGAAVRVAARPWVATTAPAALPFRPPRNG